MRSYVYTWNAGTWRERATGSSFDEKYLRYAASDKFRQRGIEPGDRLYVANVNKGLLYIGGFILIDAIVDAAEASLRLGIPVRRLYPRHDYAIADRSHLQLFRSRLVVPDHVVDALRFENGSRGPVPPKRNRKGGLDPQTMRSIRRLVAGHEKLLDAVLDGLTPVS
ncbi:hypothetical protein H0Z60_14535 [Ectothiorhodospiraceae bacterium WFHF3C12]|nr:hypothetical protein [Ectothiorhodospiraceae bacterium WFHF3C12]